MKKNTKISRLDVALGSQKLSPAEMKAINGGFACYCGTTYKGEYTDICACANDCGVACGGQGT